MVASTVKFIHKRSPIQFFVAIILLVAGCLAGLTSSLIYIFPNFLYNQGSLMVFRPMHVSLVIFWIIMSATWLILQAIESPWSEKRIKIVDYIKLIFWILAIVAICSAYVLKQFGGREYWEYPPLLSLLILPAILLFAVELISALRKIKGPWPVYYYMWVTGILFFLFEFLENHLWILSWFRVNPIADLTLQWKVNGSLVGAWNQMLYGILFYITDAVLGERKAAFSRQAFMMYALGLINLMFNWGHHIYTLPTASSVKYIGYLVSMTEWVFLLNHLHAWKKQSILANLQKNNPIYFGIRGVELWMFANLCLALLMSIPAFNLFSHGTHITVAHAMGTTIGINTLIILSSACYFVNKNQPFKKKTAEFLIKNFRYIHISLAVFLLMLIIAGFIRMRWQMNDFQQPFSSMMESLITPFIGLTISGLALTISLIRFAFELSRNLESKINLSYQNSIKKN